MKKGNFLRAGAFALILVATFIASCGRPESIGNGAGLKSTPLAPQKFALVADSLATGIFADSNFAQSPRTRPLDYARLQGLLTVVGTFKGVLRHKLPALRVGQAVADMNLLFGAFTNPQQSLYRKVANMRGEGAAIVAESSLISSKVIPQSYARHVQNYTNWADKDFASIIFALGSNDICNSWQSGDDFERNYRAALRHVTTTFPGRQLYIVSPPHIPRLRDDEIGNAPIFGLQNMQCKDYYAIVTCPAYQDAGRFRDFIGRIRKVAAEYPSAVFIDVSEEKIFPEDLSGDCFHPSHAGHERFASKIAPFFTVGETHNRPL